MHDPMIEDIEQWLLPITQFLTCRTPQAWIDEAIKPSRLSLLLIDHLVCELKAAQTAALLLRKYILSESGAVKLLSHLKPFEDYIYRQEGSLVDLKQRHHFSKAELTLRDDLEHTMFSSSCSAIELTPGDLTQLADRLLTDMVSLIKEELHHFIQVLEIMEAKQIPYQNITAGRYAKQLLQGVRTHEPMTLVDKLICGAFIEARSCERFASLSPFVDAELRQFYISLLRSEARHYQDYLSLAAMLMGETILRSDGQRHTRLIDERVAYFAQREAQLILTIDPVFRFHSGIPA